MKYEIPESENQIVSEPAVCSVQEAHVNLSFDIPKKISVSLFQDMMNAYAESLVFVLQNSESDLRNRLVAASADIMEGRTMSCEDVHRNIENKYPWLCE